MKEAINNWLKGFERRVDENYGLFTAIFLIFMGYGVLRIMEFVLASIFLG